MLTRFEQIIPNLMRKLRRRKNTRWQTLFVEVIPIQRPEQRLFIRVNEDGVIFFIVENVAEIVVAKLFVIPKDERFAAGEGEGLGRMDLHVRH